MVKTQRKRVKKNLSKKNQMVDCPIGLKPFEDEFNKKIPKLQLKKTSI